MLLASKLSRTLTTEGRAPTEESILPSFRKLRIPSWKESSWLAVGTTVLSASRVAQRLGKYSLMATRFQLPRSMAA